MFYSDNILKHVFYFGGFRHSGIEGLKKARKLFRGIYRLDPDDAKGWIKLDNEIDAKFPPVKVSEHFYWENNWARMDTDKLPPTGNRVHSNPVITNPVKPNSLL